MRKPEKTLTERTEAYAKLIRDLRKDNDMSQERIAQLLNISQRTYSDYERGRVRLPIDSLIILARFYDVDMNYICGLSKEKNTFPKK